MLKIYLGKDDTRMQGELQNVLSEYTKQGLEVHRIDTENYYPGVLTETAKTVSLFGAAPVYVLLYPSTNVEFEAEFFKNIDILQNSEHQFLVTERSLTAAQKKQCKDIECIELEAGKKAESFDVFSLTKLLIQKNKKDFWIQFQAAQNHAVAPEAIIGILWWQLKVIKLTYKTNTAAEAGVSDFVYKNAARAKTVWPEQLLDKKMFTLLTVYHEGHAGVRNINEGLEEWILKL